MSFDNNKHAIWLWCPISLKLSSFVKISHTMITESRLLLIKYLLSFVNNNTSMLFVFPLNTAISLFLFIFHTRIVRSSDPDPDAISLESSLPITTFIEFLCPSNTHSSLFFFIFLNVSYFNAFILWTAYNIFTIIRK